MRKFLIFLGIYQAVLILLWPGYLSALLGPILFLFVWVGSNEPSFKPLNPKHNDINEAMKKKWYRDVMLRKGLRPKSFHILWPIVFIILTMTPGFFAGLYYVPKELSAFYYSVRILWWMLFSPVAIIAIGYFLIDIIFAQMLANCAIALPFLLFLFAGYYLAFENYGGISMLVITVGLLLPLYILDLSRFLRQHFFPKSYDQH